MFWVRRLMTLVCSVLFGLVFYKINAGKFDEIDVQRINVVEADGKLRMGVSNQVFQHQGTMDGGLVFDGNTGKGQVGVELWQWSAVNPIHSQTCPGAFSEY